MRILVIEDDEAIRSVLERGLRAEGFDVDACADGPSGLWKGLEGGHAAIVLDLLLGGMSGYDVRARLRQSTRPEVAHIPSRSSHITFISCRRARWRGAGGAPR